MIGSLLARYATKAMLNTAAKAALRGNLDAAKKAIPHVIAHKLTTTIAKKRKGVDKGMTDCQESFCGYRWYWYKWSHRRIWYCIGLTK